MKNDWGLLSSTFHVEQPETLIEWKFKSMTYLPTYGHLTSRDTCVSKNDEDEEDTVGGSKGGCGHEAEGGLEEVTTPGAADTAHCT